MINPDWATRSRIPEPESIKRAGQRNSKPRTLKTRDSSIAVYPGPRVSSEQVSEIQSSKPPRLETKR
jgi:hypothetical protein